MKRVAKIVLVLAVLGGVVAYFVLDDPEPRVFSSTAVDYN